MASDTSESILAAISAGKDQISRLIGETFAASDAKLSADERAALAEGFQTEILKLSDGLDSIHARVASLGEIDSDSRDRILSAVQGYTAEAVRLSVVARDFAQGAPLQGIA